MLDLPKKSWLAITDHAKTCVIDDYKLYGYHSQEPEMGLLFNSIYILVGVTFDWQNYYSPDILTPHDKVWIRNLFVIGCGIDFQEAVLVTSLVSLK